ncbi:MAG: vWA domain-containing protein [Ktedonobacteraceae bacterium]
MSKGLCRQRPLSLYQLPLAIFFILSIVLGEFLSIGAGNVQAYALALPVSRLTLNSTCPAVGDPTSNSLLVVLLDRSGSLIAVPGATDPQHYSTSVTKSLAELWPGRMAVVPFQNNVTVVPHYGPATLSDPQQKADLENQIDQTNSTIGGGTPLEAAMRAGLELLNGAPSGSRVVLITDGAPGNLPPGLSYKQQVQDITGGIIQQYCSEGFPISAFGLTITDNNANTLLDEITTGTGGTYQDVTSPKELSTAVVSLYSDWQRLNFTQETGQGGNFPVTLDSFVQQVTIVTFRTNSSYSVTLDDPNNRPVQGLQPATDNHYEIDKLNEGVFVAGVYTVHISDITGNNDPDAQVYILVKSPLHIKITAPTTQRVVYGKPVEIDAAYFDGTNQLTPAKNTAALHAKVSLFVNGKQVGPTNEIVLTQQGNVFKGQTPVYKQAGQLVIQIVGSYQGDQRTADTHILLVAPPPPIPPCQLWDIQCQWQRNSTQVIIFFGLIFLVLVLLIVFLILWLRRRKHGPPYGILTNGSPNGTTDFGQDYRGKSRIHSNEVQNKSSISFDNADFNFVFTKKGLYLQPTKKNNSEIAVKTGVTEVKVQHSKDLPAELTRMSTILIDQKPRATFKG